MTDNPQPLDSSFSQALRRPEALWIILSNAIPIAGVLFFNWPAFSLLLFYWLENVAIGVVNAFKIALAGLSKGKAGMGITAFLVPFFTFHYGLFCYVHGMFLIAMFEFADAFKGTASNAADTSDLVAVVSSQLAQDADLRWSVLLLIAIQAAWFIVVWVGSGKWRTVDPKLQMIEPYGRIIVMHLTILIATLPVLLLGQPLIAVAALAVLKCGMELGLPLLTSGIGTMKDPPADKFPD